MKTKFDSMLQQMSYINRFIDRKTDLKKKCIVCGKPAYIQHNKINPYIIRPVCRICKNEYNLYGRTVDQTLDVLPTINILDHVNSEFRNYSDRTLTEDQMKLIDENLKLNLTKTEFSKRLNVYPKALEWMITKYDSIKPGIKEEFIRSTDIGRRNKLLNLALNRDSAGKVNNKIKEIKKQKHLSTKDIVDKANHQISVPSLNLIIEGKLKPSDKFKKIISEALEVKIEDIF